MKISRRSFLVTSIMGIIGCKSILKPPIPGSLCGANHSLAHRRPSQGFPPPTSNKEVDVLIVGGGVAGLSAARRLRMAGIDKIAIIELESTLGGNAIGGKNSVSSYPWGAHYLPLPNNTNAPLLHLLSELDVVTLGIKPEYRPEYLCASPQERLFIYGKWQDGLVPQRGLTSIGQAEVSRFLDVTETFRYKLGRDGKFIFDIPLANSSQDPEALALDSYSMKRWMQDNSFTLPELQWYVNYCCRDDYGTSYEEVSAWAGLHYFSSRRADPLKADSNNVLTWSEGNYWLTERMRKANSVDELSGTIVFRIDQDVGGITAYCFNNETSSSFTIGAKSCVLAVPQFVRARLISKTQTALSSYSPWIVANITLDRLPEGHGAELSWDNVIYNSRLLGYVHAKHQSLERTATETVITYYYPMSEYPPDLARMIAYNASISELQALFLTELLRIHPELRGEIRNVDVWIWGHAMIRPTPHTIWPTTTHPEELPAGVFAAHSDQSGISIFEEAFYRGIVAGESALNYMGKGAESWL